MYVTAAGAVERSEVWDSPVCMTANMGLDEDGEHQRVPAGDDRTVTKHDLTHDGRGSGNSDFHSPDDVHRKLVLGLRAKRATCSYGETNLNAEDNTNSRKRKNGFSKAALKIEKILGENLNCDYLRVYSRNEADVLLKQCEESLEYFTGDLARIRVCGKWHDIRRKQVAHGDLGVTYKYSGVTVPAKPWTPLLTVIRDRIQGATGHKFNFVLINRYANGSDYMGEHRDDEKELVATSPIASLSLGQHRDFVFRHCEARGLHAKRNIAPVKLELTHGSLLVMNYPTNVYWYHSLPVRKRALHVRINMTFRDIHVVNSKS